MSELSEKLAEAQSELKQAEKVHVAAVRAFESAIAPDSGMTTEQKLELSTAAVNARLTVEGKQSRVADAEFNAKSVALTNANQRVQELVRAAIAAELDTYGEFVVTDVIISGTFDSDGQPLVNVRVRGEGIPQSRKGTRAASGNGSRARKTYTVNGTDYGSRSLIETFGSQYMTGKVSVSDVLENPTKHGLSHWADRIADKLGATITSA